MNSASCCGVIGRLDTASAENFSFTSGWASAVRKSVLTLLAIDAGVRGGATSTNQPEAAKSGKVSETVGTSGCDASRVAEVVASSLRLGAEIAAPSMNTWTRLLITSLIACATPG